MSKSEIITKTSEISEKTMDINHTVMDGKAILIGERDAEGNLRVLLEIKSGTDYEVNIKGTITDKKTIIP